MRKHFSRLVIAPALVFATLAAATPAPRANESAASPSAHLPSPVALPSVSALPLVVAPAPPDGTYIYELSRNGTAQGRTTVVITRRPERGTIETDESGAIGAARAHVLASFRVRDLDLDFEIATYQAPFPRNVPLGTNGPERPHPGFADQQILRYRSDISGLAFTIDGKRGETRIAAPGAFVFDAPFMTAPLLAPAFVRRRYDARALPYSAAFAPDMIAVTPRAVTGAPHFAKTPKTDAIVQFPGVADLWYGRGDGIVHEAHFLHLNIDARLVSYARSLDVPPFEPLPTMAAKPKLESSEVTFASEDGTMLAGVMSRSPGVTKKLPAVVFIAPGAGVGRNYGGEGPDPMYPDLAFALAMRGYAVIRYDARGVSKSGGSRDAETWEESLADAEAAERFAQGNDGIDASRVYALGYGTGGDLALASAATGNESENLAGVVALAPTTIAYRACATATRSPADVWQKSSFAHDPAALAARGHDPALIMHPGIARCAEPLDAVVAYDDRLRSSNSRATIVVANDLTARFGGRYDADAPANSEAIFPYHFDSSTIGAIGDWLDSPKLAARPASAAPDVRPPAQGRQAPPPPPGTRAATPRPLPSRSFEPGQVATPSTFGATATPMPAPTLKAP